jgi:copper resistance protein B
MNSPAAIIAGVMLLGLVAPAKAQSVESGSSGQATATVPGWGSPMDSNIFVHVLFDQLEGRSNGTDNSFRWDAEGWIGTDMNRLWVKSGGFLENGKLSDGDNELLYDRPLPRWRYFDVQAGVREDLDSSPGRTWGAVGIEGLAPYFFQFAPTFYFSNDRVAARLTGSYDLLLTQRLILQPEVEINFYSKRDPRRGIGSGLADIDTGLRLRYEISRKFGPYIGFAYSGKFGESATFVRQAGEPVHDPRLVFGVRIWY